jgi:hypothetical protein
MMKYGESGSDDEAGSASGSEDDEVSEPEKEEETAVLLNRPPKRARQESKTEQAGTTLVPKEEGPSLGSSKSRFESICNALGDLQAEHDRRSDLLKEACLIAACGPAELPDQIRKLMVDQAKVEDNKKLKEENARLNLEVGKLLNDNRAAWVQAEAAAAAAEKIRVFASQSGQVVAKAQLFDEKVGIGSKPSGTRIAMILTDYSEKLEQVLGEMRVVVTQVADILRQPVHHDWMASSSKGLPTLSKLSLPDNFSEVPIVDALTGAGVTPESRIPFCPHLGGKLERKIQYRPTVSGSELEEVPVPDLDQRTDRETQSQETETAGFSTPKAKK